MVLDLSADHANERMVYLSPYSLLVSTPKGIRRVHCPFPVFPKNGIVGKIATQVGSSSSGNLLFMLDGEWVSYREFLLEI